ncbi:hypothetical protein CDD83_482 [Cordyceps sp. RAO-2017]|nr:hypothetical protein CDD83_482 [Cordyceps sp. RAO-2017]
MPRCLGSVPVISVPVLLQSLAVQPMTEDFWTPIPSRSVLARFLLLDDVPRLDLGLSDDPDSRLEHRMGGLLHGIRLRSYMVRELGLMSCEAKWPLLLASLHPPVGWRQASQRSVERLQRESVELRMRFLSGSYDLPAAEYMARLCREVEHGWVACMAGRPRGRAMAAVRLCVADDGVGRGIRSLDLVNGG